MTFWTESTLDPVRKYRFKVNTYSPTGDITYWFAKSVDKPSFDINTSEYQITNHKFKFPGVLTWSDINLTLVDVGGKALETIRQSLRDQGWIYPDDPNKGERGIQKKKGGATQARTYVIEQFDAAGDQP